MGEHLQGINLQTTGLQGDKPKQGPTNTITVRLKIKQRWAEKTKRS